MKNTDPPDSNGHTLKLTPELERFIHHMGGYFENSGVPPIGGLILGLLMIAHAPLTAEEIASILKVSRASISTNFKVLAAAGLLEKLTSRADRTTRYLFPETGLEQAMILNIQRSMTFKRIVDEGLAAVPEKDVAHQRLRQADDYAQLVITSFEKMLAEWRERSRQALKLSATH